MWESEMSKWNEIEWKRKGERWEKLEWKRNIRERGVKDSGRASELRVK